MILNNKGSLVFHYLLVFFGLIIFLWVIWGRFIRERLPKDIPFMLSELGFWVIIYICCSYILIICMLLKSKKKKKINDKNPFKEIINMLYLPLIKVDHLLKYNVYVKKSYSRFMFYFFLKLKSNTALVIVIPMVLMVVIPRLILVMLFFTDVFYFQKLAYIYKYIYIGLLPLSFRYIKYSLTDIVDYWIGDLGEKYGPVSVIEANSFEIFNTEQVLELVEYLEFKFYQAIGIEYIIEKSNLIYNTTKLYLEEVYLKDIFFEKYCINNKSLINDNNALEHYSIMRLEYIKFYDVILKSKLFGASISHIEMTYFRYFRVIIYCIYLISWLYILLYSFLTYPLDFFETLVILEEIITKLENPFT